MTIKEWLDRAKRDREDLVALISRWHPGMHKPHGTKLKITAPNAEGVAEVIRTKIAKESKGMNPVEEFNKALDGDDMPRVYSLLNNAWFGVPESTECWRERGFSKAVALLEDPPENESDPSFLNNTKEFT